MHPSLHRLRYVRPALLRAPDLRGRPQGAGSKVKGLINIQFTAKDSVVYILEANPRASRTVPFVSKALAYEAKV
ncbi:MAG: hypothetical protein AAB268_10690 [Elusimicrobiota bacterium]